jgi:dUTP pyrophosphatase
MNLEVKKLSPDVKTPRRATRFSACYDVSYNPIGECIIGYTDENYKYAHYLDNTKVLIIQPGYRMLVPTGLILNIPGGHHVKLYPRSSLGYKRGLIMANSVGIIDEDYKDPLYVILFNSTRVPLSLEPGERIAQIELCQTSSIRFITDDGDAENDSNAPERNGGLGSTGN